MKLIKQLQSPGTYPLDVYTRWLPSGSKTASDQWKQPLIPAQQNKPEITRHTKPHGLAGGTQHRDLGGQVGPPVLNSGSKH